MDLSILNEKTVLYYDEIGLIEYGAFKKGTIEELHNAIKINRIDELSAHLSMWNVRETSIIDFIENKLIVNLSKLRDKIKQEEELIEPHDIDYYDVVRFCEEFIPALKKELQVLKAREINEPTKYDKLVLEHIIKIADDMQRVSDYIGNKIKELSSVAAIRRLNFFISEIEKKTDLPNQAFILDKLKATLQATQQEAEQRKQQQNNDVYSRQTDVSSRQTPISFRQTEPQHGQPLKETTEERRDYQSCSESPFEPNNQCSNSPWIIKAGRFDYTVPTNHKIYDETLNMDNVLDMLDRFAKISNTTVDEHEAINRLIRFGCLQPLFSEAKKNRGQNNLKLIVKRLRQYFISEWYDTVAVGLVGYNKQCKDTHSAKRWLSQIGKAKDEVSSEIAKAQFS